MTRLPVRSGADIHLADAFEAPGCPLCRERHRTEANYLESILAESVLDVGFRSELDAARGLCGTHARAFLDADRKRSGTLGASILLRATLVARLREVEAAAAANGWSRARRVAVARRPPACPACARVAVADSRSVETVVHRSEDGAWSEAASAAPFCLDHLLALMAVRPVPGSWRPVEARQVDRLRELRDRLDAFAHASAQDRRHLQTDDQRASAGDAANLLAGPTVLPAGGPAPGAGASGAPRHDRRAVLVAGVYGAGKTTLAVEIVDRLEAAGVPAAAIDLDWLAWHGAPVAWDEHEDPRLTIEHLAVMAARYAGLGVTRLVLAGYMPPGTRARYAAAVGASLSVVELRATADLVRRRLEGDPNASRADDLDRALARLAADATVARLPAEPDVDWSIDADVPVAELASAVLARLGWLPLDPAAGRGSID